MNGGRRGPGDWAFTLATAASRRAWYSCLPISATRCCEISAVAESTTAAMRASLTASWVSCAVFSRCILSSCVRSPSAPPAPGATSLAKSSSNCTRAGGQGCTWEGAMFKPPRRVRCWGGGGCLSASGVSTDITACLWSPGGQGDLGRMYGTPRRVRGRGAKECQLLISVSAVTSWD